MAYIPTTWVNGSAPAVSASNLNNIESGIVASLRIDGTNTMSSQISVIQGSSTTPSIAYFNDLNTGIFWSSADKLAITEGGKSLTFDEFKMMLSMGAML